MLAMTQTHLRTRTSSVKPETCSQSNVTGRLEETILYHTRRVQQFTTYWDGIYIYTHTHTHTHTHTYINLLCFVGTCMKPCVHPSHISIILKFYT